MYNIHSTVNDLHYNVYRRGTQDVLQVKVFDIFIVPSLPLVSDVILPITAKALSYCPTRTQRYYI